MQEDRNLLWDAFQCHATSEHRLGHAPEGGEGKVQVEYVAPEGGGGWQASIVWDYSFPRATCCSVTVIDPNRNHIGPTFGKSRQEAVEKMNALIAEKGLGVGWLYTHLDALKHKPRKAPPAAILAAALAETEMS